MGLRLLAAVVALISTTFLSPTAQAANLESVLADQANLTTFRGLVKVSVCDDSLSSWD